jgi:hypothetical protein
MKPLQDQSTSQMLKAILSHHTVRFRSSILRILVPLLRELDMPPAMAISSAVETLQSCRTRFMCEYKLVVLDDWG